MVLSILASFVCKIIGKLASKDRTIPARAVGKIENENAYWKASVSLGK